MRFVVEVRFENDDHARTPPVTVGVIERGVNLTPASGLGLLLQETKDLLRELQTVVVAEQAARFVSAVSRCRCCSTSRGVKDTKRYCQLAEPGRKLMLISAPPSDQAGRRPNVFAQVTPSQAAKAWLRFVRFSVASTL